MRITKLSLTNFRSFKATQTIEFAPVTLLFGPNSVGKSSLLMALAYVQQILTKGHCDPMQFNALGGKQINGFQALVNGHDLTKNIVIRLDFLPLKTIIDRYPSSATDISQEPYLLMNEIADDMETAAIELEVAWSNQFQRAYVKHYKVWLNKQFIGAIESDANSKNASITKLNLEHPMLIPYNHDDWIDENGFDEDEPFDSEFKQVLEKTNPNTASFRDIPDDAKAPFSIPPISIGSSDSGALPPLYTFLYHNLEGGDIGPHTEYLNHNVITSVLTNCFVLPLDMMAQYLQASAFIGPFRMIPNSDFIANFNPTQGDWFEGRAAWDLLHRNPDIDSEAEERLDYVDDCLINKLNTGYHLLNQSIASSSNANPLPPLSPWADNLVNKRYLCFEDRQHGAQLTASQIGTGISQILPIITASKTISSGFVSIEQPELHIHPRLQVELGDLFINAAHRKLDPAVFIIETHSEHLILRLLKRIRQTTDKELPENMTEVLPETISIVYLEDTEDGVKAKCIRIDEDGEFKERWPQGFFAERREELM